MIPRGSAPLPQVVRHHVTFSPFNRVTIMSKELLEALQDIQKAVNAGDFDCHSEDEGICYFLRINYGYSLHYIFRELCLPWPEYSGSFDFPVPSPDKSLRPEQAYYLLPKWKGEYGEARKRLLQWCIDELRKELSESSPTYSHYQCLGD